LSQLLENFLPITQVKITDRMEINNLMVRINKFPQNLLMKLKGLIGVQHKTIYVKKKKEVRKNNVRQHSPIIAHR